MRDTLVNCPSCGHALIQKSRSRLFITGILIVAGALAMLLAVRLVVTVLAALLLIVFGGYFIVWAVRADGLWCRDCKRFP